MILFWLSVIRLLDHIHGIPGGPNNTVNYAMEHSMDETAPETRDDSIPFRPPDIPAGLSPRPGLGSNVMIRCPPFVVRTADWSGSVDPLRTILHSLTHSPTHPLTHSL